MKRAFFLQIFLLLIFVSNGATTDKNIEFHEFEYWNKLLGYDLSSDGNWAFWRLQYGDNVDSLFIRSTKGTKIYKYASASIPEFSKDGKWIAFSVPVPQTSGESTLSYQIKLVELATGCEKVFTGIERFSFSPNGRFIVLSSSGSQALSITLRELASGRSKSFVGIGEYAFSPDDRYLVYAMDAPESDRLSQIEIADLTDFRTTFPDIPKGRYTKLKWTPYGILLMKSKPEADVVIWEPVRKRLKVLSETIKQLLPPEMEISLGYTPVWSSDGKVLFFGLSRKRGTMTEAENKVEIWHWKDQEIMSRQKDRYYENIAQSRLCAWRPAENEWMLIEDPTMTGVLAASADGTYVLCSDDRKYRPHFREPVRDVFLKNTRTGAIRPILDSTVLYPRFSAGGKYVYYFRDSLWRITDVATGQTVSVSLGANRPLADKTYDGAIDAVPSWGGLGIVNGDREFLFYDEYDIWSVTLPALKYKRLTHGREAGIRFRKMGKESFVWNGSQLLIGKSDSGEIGIYRYSTNGNHIRLLYGRNMYSRLVWDAKKKSCLFAQEDNTAPPILYYASDNCKVKRVLATTFKNCNQPKIEKSVLVSYTDNRGNKLQGALFFPANYQPGRKYPMVVKLYEKLSQQLDCFVYPSSRDAYNSMNYILQGYFVFLPDVTYERNHPGESAVACVTNAVRSVESLCRDIDPTRIGIIGHSWGAYQAVYLAARTSLFAACIAGAPLTNMISMYNSVYWENGKSNQELFETGQARLRQPWWEIPEHYRQNSPVFFADKINRPLLMSFGMEDRAVDWRQGLELYLTMRRLRKPCILLAYPNEGHTIGEIDNEKDQTRRFIQFFSTYLKGETAPSWIENGCPYMEKRVVSLKETEKSLSGGK